MPSGMFMWSQTAANNATADSSINWQEGQAPSSVNDSARGMMASQAKWRDDISGAIVTGGTSTNYTLTTFSAFDSLAHMNGQMIAFTPHATNGGGGTNINVDGLGLKPLYTSPLGTLEAGTLIQGTPYTAIYNSAAAAFYLRSFFGNPYNIPLGAGMDYWLPTAPNSSFVFPIGQAISRTTYAALFAAMGTTHGVGDGSTTFNLPDKTGRVSAMKETAPDGSRRLNTTYFGDSTALGSGGGLQTSTLVNGNLPPYTPAGSVTVAGSTIYYRMGQGNTGAQVVDLIEVASVNGVNQSRTFPAPAASFAGNAQGGTSAPVRTIQPTIICNYIMRIL